MNNAFSLQYQKLQFLQKVNSRHLNVIQSKVNFYFGFMIVRKRKKRKKRKKEVNFDLVVKIKHNINVPYL